MDGCPATRSPKALECLCLQGRQYQLESEFLSLPTQDHHSSLNPVARMKKIVRCTFEAAQCYAPTVISPDDLLAVGPSTPLDSNDQLYNLRSMTMSTRPCFPMLAPRSWYTIYSAAPPSGYLLRLSLIAREPQRTVRSIADAGRAYQTFLPLSRLLSSLSSLGPHSSRSHSIYLSAQAPTPAEYASPAFPAPPSPVDLIRHPFPPALNTSSLN